MSMENIETDTALAIASVPIQKWGTVYDDTTALEKGTVFPKLNKPFYKADDSESIPKGGKKLEADKDPEQMEREELLSKINEVSFAVNDLTLYLDTHENDSEALNCFTERLQERTRLMKAFAGKFYPLTQVCMADCGVSDKFSWTEGPMPWEGACV